MDDLLFQNRKEALAPRVVARFPDGGEALLPASRKRLSAPLPRPRCIGCRSEARDLLELTEARYKKASTVFCSQFDVGGWHQKIGEATLADAICDRIVHDSYRALSSAEKIPCASARAFQR